VSQQGKREYESRVLEAVSQREGRKKGERVGTEKASRGELTTLEVSGRERGGARTKISGMSRREQPACKKKGTGRKGRRNAILSSIQIEERSRREGRGV